MRKLSIVLLLLAGCAQAPGGGSLAGKPAPAGGAGMASGEAARIVSGLPSELGGLRADAAVIDFEARGLAGGGASRSYTDPAGQGLVTVYLYDRGGAQQPEGPHGQAAQQEQRMAVGEIGALARARNYRSLRYVNSLSSTVPGRGTDCAQMESVRGDGVPAGEAVCVTVHRERFLKVRVTLLNPPHATAAGRVGAMVSEEVMAILSRATMVEAPSRLAALF